MSIETKRKMKILFDLVKTDQRDCKEVNDILDTLIKKFHQQTGLLRITGADIAAHIDIFVSNVDLLKTAKELYKDAEYDFTKCLWVEYPDGTEKRLDSVVDY